MNATWILLNDDVKPDEPPYVYWIPLDSKGKPLGGEFRTLLAVRLLYRKTHSVARTVNGHTITGELYKPLLM